MPKVKTSDGKEFTLSSFCLEMSEQLRGPEGADRPDDEVVPAGCAADVFQHILDYMLAVEADFKASHPDITDETEMHPDRASFHHFGKADQPPLLGIREYERKFLDRFGGKDDLNINLITDVLVAADSLQVFGLPELLARRIADFMRSRRPEFIREHFHIPPPSAEVTKAASEMFDFYKAISA